MAALFVEILLDAHNRPPRWIVLDLDATDDPIHGQQEAGYFHGYYDCHCYLPLYIFCDRFLLAASAIVSCWRRSSGRRTSAARMAPSARWRAWSARSGHVGRGFALCCAATVTFPPMS